MRNERIPCHLVALLLVFMVRNLLLVFMVRNILLVFMVRNLLLVFVARNHDYVGDFSLFVRGY